MFELCETLGMTKQQLLNNASAHELTVEWPAYMGYKARERKRQEDKEEQRGRRR